MQLMGDVSKHDGRQSDNQDDTKIKVCPSVRLCVCHRMSRQGDKEPKKNVLMAGDILVDPQSGHFLVVLPFILDSGVWVAGELHSLRRTLGFEALAGTGRLCVA